MHVQVCRWQSVAPEHRQQAVDLLRQAFPDMQGEGYAIPGPVALVLAMGGDQVVAHLALYERNVLLDGEPERIGLIGGVVVTETVYAIPGLGSLTVDAVLNRDFPVIQGVVLFFSVLYVLINLLVDLSYLWLDPRIRY